MIATSYSNLLANGFYFTRSKLSTVAANPYRQSAPIEYLVPLHQWIDLVRWPPRGHSSGRHASNLTARRRSRLTRDGLTSISRGGARRTDQAGCRQLRDNDRGIDRWTMDRRYIVIVLVRERRRRRRSEWNLVIDNEVFMAFSVGLNQIAYYVFISSSS
jgi:hypothetical protein